jgi:hypothetical protein
MKLQSGRETVEIQRDGYSEVLLTDGGEMTDSEWSEYAERTAAANRMKLAEQRELRLAQNRALFNRDRSAVRVWPCCQGLGCHDITCAQYGQPKTAPDRRGPYVKMREQLAEEENSIAAGPIEGPGRCDIEIRWNAQARAFFVEYGNVRFSVTRLDAILWLDAISERYDIFKQMPNPCRSGRTRMRSALAAWEQEHAGEPLP